MVNANGMVIMGDESNPETEEGESNDGTKSANIDDIKNHQMIRIKDIIQPNGDHSNAKHTVTVGINVPVYEEKDDVPNINPGEMVYLEEYDLPVIENGDGDQ